MSTRRFAQTILTTNAATSAISGLALLLLPGVFADLLFTAPTSAHVLGTALVGAGLLIFAVDVALIARDKFLTSKDLYLVSVADDAWVLASIAALVFYSAHLTSFGWYAVAAVAAGVAGFAISQSLIALRLSPPRSQFSMAKAGKGFEISVTRETRASAETVWQVMTDHPGYADVADNLSKVDVLSGEGPNTRRKCYGPKGESWTETCDLYQDGKVFGFKVQTDAADYPYPFKKVQGRWSVASKGPGAEFTVVIKVEPKNGYTALMMQLVGFRNIRALMINLADRWAERMEREERGPALQVAAE